MEIKLFKQQVEQGKVDDSLIIFQLADINSLFVAEQYLHKIAKDKGYPVINLNSKEELPQDSMFDIPAEIFRLDIEKLDFKVSKKNLVIICTKIDNTVSDYYQPFIVKIPKIEDWQLKDYLYSNCEGLNNKKLDYLFDLCNKNAFILDNEMSKITAIKAGRDLFFDICFKEKQFDHLIKYSIYDLSNSFLRKDLNSLQIIYNYIDTIDNFNVFSFVSLLVKNFKNIISIQLDNRATAESCGLSDKQFWAIKKYNCGYYTKDQLIKIYNYLLLVDKQIKLGLIDTSNILDYLIIKIFTA